MYIVIGASKWFKLQIAISQYMATYCWYYIWAWGKAELVTRYPAAMANNIANWLQSLQNLDNLLDSKVM